LETIVLYITSVLSYLYLKNSRTGTNYSCAS